MKNTCSDHIISIDQGREKEPGNRCDGEGNGWTADKNWSQGKIGREKLGLKKGEGREEHEYFSNCKSSITDCKINLFSDC